MREILAKRAIVDEHTTAIYPKVWSRPNDSGLCVLVAGTPGCDTPVDTFQVNEASEFIYDNLVKLQFSQLHPTQFEDLIRELFAECERNFCFEYFVSVGVVIREGRSVFVASVGNVETWYLRDMGLLQLTSQTTMELPVPTRNKIFLSCLGGNSFKGEFSHTFRTASDYSIVLLATGSKPLGRKAMNLLAPTDIEMLPPQFEASLRECGTACLL